MFNKFFLVVRFKGLFDRIVCVDAPQVVIGRDADCELRLVNDFVSRRHSLIERTDSGFSIRDLGSRNPTRVNHRQLNDRHELREFDVVWIVLFTLRVFLTQGAAEKDIECDEDSTRSFLNHSDDADTIDELKSSLRPSLHEVYDALMDAATEKEICQRCQITKSTAHYCVRQIYEALDVHSHAELIRKARMHRDHARP